jgi:hypothetical protein
MEAGGGSKGKFFSYYQSVTLFFGGVSLCFLAVAAKASSFLTISLSLCI